MAVILEHLYKYEHFKEDETMGNSWVGSILSSRNQIYDLFEESPSLKNKAKEEVELAWKSAVRRLINWFKYPENKHLADKYIGRKPTEKDFPEKCPYTFNQIIEYEPWEEKNV